MLSRRFFGVIALVVMVSVPAFRSAIGADENRYDIMRLVTTQWIKPYMYLVLDKSGSMHMTLDQSYNSSYRWYFEYDSSIDGYITLEDDWTDNSYRGHGQGFWLRVASRALLTNLRRHGPMTALPGTQDGSTSRIETISTPAKPRRRSTREN